MPAGLRSPNSNSNPNPNPDPDPDANPNLGMYPLAYAVGANHGVLTIAKCFLPLLRKFTFVLALGNGEIGMCPNPFPTCVQYEAGFQVSQGITITPPAYSMKQASR